MKYLFVIAAGMVVTIAGTSIIEKPIKATILIAVLVATHLMAISL